MTLSQKIIDELSALFDERQATHLARFFKTGKGQYGEGNKFLGIKVPMTRNIVKKYKDNVTLDDVDKLLDSEWHEIRLAGFLLLLELYRKALKLKDRNGAKALVKYYMSSIDKGNNWDLVDLVSHYILGDWVLRNPDDEKIFMELAGKEGKLWHQRVAIVSTFSLIKAGKFESTFQIAQKYLTHPHDLIHKASGWMLREIGKRGGKDQLVKFLNKYGSEMPRTMLRYAIERFPEEERIEFLKIPRSPNAN